MYDEQQAKRELELEYSMWDKAWVDEFGIEQMNQHLELVFLFISTTDVAKVLATLRGSLPYKDQLPARKAIYDYMVREIGAERLKGLE